ncbi:MAG: hypothetical protein LBJ11_01295 [Oscillospiraceae bacterium]|jgi:hypothetical protein|nr:hypothetical protein [Oscillospiraceae bacterium]
MKKKKLLFFAFPAALVLLCVTLCIQYLTSSYTFLKAETYLIKHTAQQASGTSRHSDIEDAYGENLYILPEDRKDPHQPFELLILRPKKFLRFVPAGRYEIAATVSCAPSTTGITCGSYLFTSRNTVTGEKASTKTLLLFGSLLALDSASASCEYTVLENGNSTSERIVLTPGRSFAVFIHGLGTANSVTRAFLEAKFYDADGQLLYVYQL